MVKILVMKKLLIFVLSIFVLSLADGQVYEDFLGAGHDIGISVEVSSNRSANEGSKTISGQGLDANIYDAGRFLSQASFGPTAELLGEFNDPSDYEPWIDHQMSMGFDSMTVIMDSIYEAVTDMRLAGGQNPNAIQDIGKKIFFYAWGQENTIAPYTLRHKVAHALGQHFVVSMNSKLGNQIKIVSIGSFYDMLLGHSFGNFRDLLEDVSFHPAMGFYLTHMNNSRAFPEDNIFPDENYAREIMQLFTIGIHMLNQDGTLILDADGEPIPTYDNDDINQMAKVFTGLGPGAIQEGVSNPTEPFFGLNFFATSFEDPMVMYEFFHEPGEILMPDGTPIPEDYGPLQDIEYAHDWLFNHQNTAPFFCKRLIQRLVKSNPTPAYVERMSNVFDDNGNGLRGDIGAVVKAILLDEEARSADSQFSESAGRVKEPIERSIAAIRALRKDKLFDRYWDVGNRWNLRLKNAPMQAPSVFNFFLPDYIPSGPISDAGLVSPELQLHYSTSAIEYANLAYTWGWQNNLMSSGENNFGDSNVQIDYDVLTPLAASPDLLLNYLDRMLTYGSLSDQTRAIIRNAMLTFNENQLEIRARLATYLVLMSPEYVVTH